MTLLPTADLNDTAGPVWRLLTAGSRHTDYPRESAERIWVQQVEALGRLIRVMALVGVCTAAFVFGAFATSSPAVAQPWWLMLLATYGGLFGFSLFADQRHRGQGATALRLIAGYNLLLLVLGICWGALLVQLMQVATPEQRSLLYGLSIGLVATAPLKTPISTAFASFIPITISSAVALATRHHRLDYFTALLLAGYTAMITIEIFAQNERMVRRVLHEIELEEQREVIGLLLRDFEESSSDWLWALDDRLRLRDVSPRLGRVLRLPGQAIAGRPFAAVLGYPDDDPEQRPEPVVMLLNAIERRAIFSRLIVPVRVGTESRWWSLTGKPEFDKFGRFAGYRGVGTDVTAARLSEEKISRLARYDGLTGLPNRAMFADTLREACDRPELGSHALLCLDLDDFKLVNDSHGHNLGDRVLAEVGVRLAQCIRKQDVAARFGGDEFAVLARSAGLAQATALARRIVEHLGQPYFVDGVTADIGVSIGIALAPIDGNNPEMLLRRADLALYQAKAAGRGSFVFFERRMDEQLRERQALRVDLRDALERGELRLHYQPIIGLETGAVQGFEALVRWSHPRRGLLSPGLFIPIAEEAGLIGSLGAWALREACEAAAGWPDHISIAVNLSPLQFRDGSLPGAINEALDQSGIRPTRLELELTESILLEASEHSLASLRSLRERGPRLVLDDFGTGYSSLQYLRNFAFDKIKIDRSYIGDVGRDRNAQSLVQGIVSMARGLDVRTTAEGVETAEQLTRLREFGCTQAQGYYFHPAVPLEEARSYLNRSLALASA